MPGFEVRSGRAGAGWPTSMKIIARVATCVTGNAATPMTFTSAFRLAVDELVTNTTARRSPVRIQTKPRQHNGDLPSRGQQHYKLARVASRRTESRQIKPVAASSPKNVKGPS